MAQSRSASTRRSSYPLRAPAHLALANSLSLSLSLSLSCIITKLGRVDKDRKALIAAKAATRAERKTTA